ncbi:LysR family transcriptional regulator [Raoultibacter phocaeensis]|uniref:LysR family transcriptional regulator n=1 Tax=Raoultibacter phocaeensis TaxID=2479841 RepID=UPI001119FDC1|nr:LysR family transcriptional regulator [Raoultibacter phocaeensis]
MSTSVILETGQGKRSPVTIRQIEYFVAAVECGSFTAAAEEKDITVQGLSQAVADLEREIGARLLVRGKEGTSPTPFGRECYSRAKILLRQFRDFDALIHARRRLS